MKIVIITTSPRKSFSTSKYISKILYWNLLGHNVKVIQLKTAKDLEKVKVEILDANSIVFASPVYVDSIPSTVLEHLFLLEQYILSKKLKFNVYTMINCGFYEGEQTKFAIKTFEIWANKCDLKWCGGVGIGAGVFLGFIRVIPWIGILIEMLVLLIQIIIASLSSDFSASLLNFYSNYWFPSFVIQLGLWFLWSFGMYFNIYKLSRSIRKKKNFKIKFTGPWFCPKILFVIMASLYWVIWAFLLYFKMPWQLFKKDKEDRTINI